MAKLSDQERAERSRQRDLRTAKSKGATGYKNQIVAPLFQRMIRAEFGADPRPYVTAVVLGKIKQVHRDIGEVACVTCGDVYDWTDPYKRINTGHFMGRGNPVLFDPYNVAPQCVVCNAHNYGQRDLFRIWVAFVHGAEHVERLERLKNETRQFTEHELVDLAIAFRARLKAAEQLIAKGSR